MQSKATTVMQYLAELPADRRATVEAVRAFLRATVDRDVEEGMQYGMIGFYVPLRVFPAGYHASPGTPLPYINLAAQKHGCSLYLMAAGHPAIERLLREGFARAGKRLDLGKSCLRFKRVEDLALDVIAEAIRRVPSGEWVKRYEAARAGAHRAKTRKPAATPRRKRRAPASR
ncbi:MAG: DUF1801 domain-containing protein [Anaeromyxobacter sp.]